MTVTLGAELATADYLTAGDHSLAWLELEDLPGAAAWALTQPLSLHHFQPRRRSGRPHWEAGQVLLWKGLDLSRPVAEPLTGLVQILGLNTRVDTPEGRSSSLLPVFVSSNLPFFIGFLR